jgi:catechol 2,3-dioxygenase-like lactoylglutathione lyase family enzyme
MTDLPVSQVGDLHVATVVINVSDMERAVHFWTEALGYEPREKDWNSEFMMLMDPLDLHLPVSLQRSDDRPMQPARVHLDLYTRQQDLHVERLVALGAERVGDWPYPPNADFIVLRDPDGNEFCVIDHEDLIASTES